MKFLNIGIGIGIVSCAVLLFAGCGGQKTSEAMEADANGYQCDQCNLKFYTDREVFATICPGCKPGTPFPAVGYVCAKDKKLTIVRKGKQAFCDQCKSPLEAFKAPREADLKTWGAVKKTQQEVTGS